MAKDGPRFQDESERQNVESMGLSLWLVLELVGLGLGLGLGSPAQRWNAERLTENPDCQYTSVYLHAN